MDTTSVRSSLIADAQGLPSLITAAQTVDPPLAQMLVGKALIASKSAAGVVLVPVATYYAAKYGTGWDDTTIHEVVGAVLVIAAYGLRAITASPIVTLFRQPSVPLAPTSAADPSAPQ